MGLMFNSEEHIALAKALRVRSYAAIGLIECCIHLAAVEAPRGNIGKLANDSIALGVDWAGNPDLLVEGLLSSGFFSAHLEFRLVIKRWNEIAPDECQRALAFKHTDLWDGTKPVFNQHLRISGSTCRERRRARRWRA